MDLENKTVWITGASSGIGEALAYEMAKTGAKVILSSRRETELDRVRSACLFPEKHVVFALDLELYQELEGKADEVWSQHGPIDFLINCAGLSQRYRVADSSFELDKKIMDINFLGTIALTRPLLKKMLHRNSGQIAVISSMLGLYGMQTRSAYSASKHALKGYFESLRNEVFKTEIGITLIYPGYINTHITHNALVADGTHFGRIDEVHATGISATKCAQKIVQALKKKKEVVVIAGFKERFGAFMARFFPALFRYLSPRFQV
ncbi:SDR family oxidoreductase [Legionella maioricensis]|uniref:SDR family oxidoreductase n=1 Tax=Legionella maioricensis TaxID=2896528 RepID=A0A9X2D205_9GAMM|nr:SDR family oxidoreductase [Legionella maioricensis]MCL9685059.1 SDR family oxidoreductase [Legionella maioricensis]MCL9688180.1 SDR family oxidoreductase [Legionella maioricensis]